MKFADTELRRSPIPATGTAIAIPVRRASVPGPVVGVVEIPRLTGSDRLAAPGTGGASILDEWPDFLPCLLVCPAVPALRRIAHG